MDKTQTSESFRTIRIKTSAYQRIQALAEQVRRDGWISIGAARGDDPTLTNIVDAALEALDRKREK